mgnify:CR=1 FL=1
MGRLWALTFTSVTCDFWVLSKRGNWRHPIFDRPQDLDVTVWTLGDHPCSCSSWVLGGLGYAPCLKTSRLACFVFGFAPNTCVFLLRSREWLIGLPHISLAMAWGHRPLFCCHRPNVLPVGTIDGRPPIVFAYLAFLAGRPLCICFWQIFCASCDSWHPLCTPSIHVYGGISLLLSLFCKLCKSESL